MSLFNLFDLFSTRPATKSRPARRSCPLAVEALEGRAVPATATLNGTDAGDYFQFREHVVNTGHGSVDRYLSASVWRSKSAPTGTPDASILSSYNSDFVLDGKGGNDIFDIRNDTWYGFQVRIIGGTGWDQIDARSILRSRWSLGNENEHTLQTKFTFGGIETLLGGSGSEFVIMPNTTNGIRFLSSDGQGFLDYSLWSTPVNVDLRFLRLPGLNAAISGINNLRGGTGNDVLIGDGNSNYLNGGLGDDLLDGREGNDMLEGYEGHDILLGGKGNDNLLANAGRDILVGGSGSDDLGGGSGEGDLIIGASTIYDAEYNIYGVTNQRAYRALSNVWKDSSLTNFGRLVKLYGGVTEDGRTYQLAVVPDNTTDRFFAYGGRTADTWVASWWYFVYNPSAGRWDWFQEDKLVDN